MPNAVALIPARTGSQRVPGKNLLELGGHPLLAYAIECARSAEVFDAIVVSTDSEDVAQIGRAYGAEVPGLRPREMASATSPDIEWVLHAIAALEERGRTYDLFSILRPTSPFRTGATVRRAWDQLLALADRADSIRAVEPARQHPGKMWIVDGDLMRPLLPQPESGTPTFSSQTKALPLVHVQNSSLEIAWARVLRAARPEIAGERVAPFFTEGWEGFSIDYPDDVTLAQKLVESGEVTLPAISPASKARF